MDLQIFTPNVPTDRPEMVTPDAPIQPYDGYLVPGQDEKARRVLARGARRRCGTTKLPILSGRRTTAAAGVRRIRTGWSTFPPSCGWTA